jgi:UDP-galactopyranose mutase
MMRAAREHKVFFFEEPIFEDVEAPRLDLHRDLSGVVVAVPILPVATRPSEIFSAQRKLLDQLVAAFPSDLLIAWYYTPMALTFSAHLQPGLCVYDNMDELSLFAGAPRELLDLEALLLSRAAIGSCRIR